MRYINWRKENKMTVIHLVEDLLDEKGKIMSLNGLNKVDEENLYNIRINREDIGEKYKVGLTSKEVQLIVNSGIYKRIYIKEIYNRMQELAKRATA